MSNRAEFERLVMALAVKAGMLYEECNATEEEVRWNVAESLDEDLAACLAAYDAARASALEEAATCCEAMRYEIRDGQEILRELWASDFAEAIRALIVKQPIEKPV